MTKVEQRIREVMRQLGSLNKYQLKIFNVVGKYEEIRSSDIAEVLKRTSSKTNEATRVSREINDMLENTALIFKRFSGDDGRYVLYSWTDEAVYVYETLGYDRRDNPAFRYSAHIEEKLT